MITCYSCNKCDVLSGRCMAGFTDCSGCLFCSPRDYLVKIRSPLVRDLLCLLEELRSKAISDRDFIEDEIARTGRKADFSDFDNLNALGRRMQIFAELIECVKHAVPSDYK